MPIRFLPYPIGTKVLYGDREYVISEFRLGMNENNVSSWTYAICNLPAFGIAWVEHSKLTFVESPTLESINILHKMGEI